MSAHPFRSIRHELPLFLHTTLLIQCTPLGVLHGVSLNENQIVQNYLFFTLITNNRSKKYNRYRNQNSPQ